MLSALRSRVERACVDFFVIISWYDCWARPPSANTGFFHSFFVFLRHDAGVKFVIIVCRHHVVLGTVGCNFYFNLMKMSVVRELCALATNNESDSDHFIYYLTERCMACVPNSHLSCSFTTELSCCVLIEDVALAQLMTHRTDARYYITLQKSGPNNNNNNSKMVPDSFYSSHLAM